MFRELLITIGILNMNCLDFGKQLIGTRYSWGGDSVEEGFDCSGFVCELLKSEGYLKNSIDLTSQQLYDHFKRHGRGSGIQPKSLIFYGKSNTEITHVGMAVDYENILESAGEGRVENNKGFVRMRPINYRSDVVAAIKI